VTPDVTQLAHSLTERVADVLSTSVVLTSEGGEVLASSGDAAAARGSSSLVFPLRLNGMTCRLHVSETIGGETVSPHVRRLLVELAVDQAALLLRLPQQAALKDRFIHELLKGSVGNEADALREGQILGMELARPRAVLLVDAGAYLHADRSTGEHATRRRAQVVIESIVRYFELPSDTICAHIGAGEVAVLKAIRREDLAAWLDRTRQQRASATWANVDALKSAAAGLLSRLAEDTAAEITIGVGRYHPRIKGLARSYQDARAALALGRRLYGPGAAYSLDELGAAAFVGVADDRTRRELAERLLSPLDDEPELIVTLARFFDRDCSLVDTARDLGIHRNTLGYRLDKIAQLTDRDPRHFGDAMQLRLAMLVRSVGDESRQVVRPNDAPPALDAKVRAPAQVAR
jgi:carbohydrate diacid regulator